MIKQYLNYHIHVTHVTDKIKTTKILKEVANLQPKSALDLVKSDDFYVDCEISDPNKLHEICLKFLETGCSVIIETEYREVNIGAMGASIVVNDDEGFHELERKIHILKVEKEGFV